MKRRLALRRAMVLGAVFYLASWTIQGQLDYAIRSDVRLVLLDVSVRDRAGQFVSGLSKDHFRIYENGRLQQITAFDGEDVPVTVGILVDESFSMRTKRSEVLAAAQTFIEESNPRDEVFVLNFNDRVTRGLPRPQLFSADLAQLRSALERGIPGGRTALNDAVVAGLEHLSLGKRNKKALMVISDGGDNASQHKRREMLSMVEKGAATIYAIGLYDNGDPDRDPGLLKDIARISGGEAYFPEDPAGTIPVCRRIARDLRARYTIGYTPRAETAHSLRNITVRVSAPGKTRLTAHTRSSYRYDEAANGTK